MTNSSPIHIETFCLGEWMTNCYVVHRQDSTAPRSGWIIDAGFNPEAMVRYLQENEIDPQKVILTHAHVDHIAGLADIRRVWPDIPILIHDAEREFLTDAVLNLSFMLDPPVIAPNPTGPLVPGQPLELDGVPFEVRHTPGHSPGGVTLIQPQAKVAFVGDALFAGSIGRTDFPTSDHSTLIESIKIQLLTLTDDTRVLSGHGPETTIGQERMNNPFLSI